MADPNTTIQIPASIWGPISTAVSGIVAGAFFVWKRFSSHKVEVAKDNAEIDVVKHLQDQRDEAVKTAKEAWHSKVVAEMALAETKAKMEQMTDQIESLRQRLALMNQLVGRLTSALDMTKQQLTNIIQSEHSDQKTLDAIRQLIPDLEE